MEEDNNVNPPRLSRLRPGLKTITPNLDRVVHDGSASLRWVMVVPNRSDDPGSFTAEPKLIKQYRGHTPYRLSRNVIWIWNDYQRHHQHFFR
ncbi:hypothetical protein TanjilG_14572 [Lupinus angustifolius]|uniref:Uncharacterized protein n=1 Tax=Lupinus angustifolius TaxID=3871 RepID=A0A1J7I5U2_LUPAN|nr:hypothetical protein TanjilG_14572 [Lupinus angustifolius]